MARQGRSFKIVFYRSSLLTKAMVLLMVVVTLTALVLLAGRLADEKKEAEALRQQAIAMEVDNARLREKIQQLGTMEAVIQIAREELGLVAPDSIVIQPE